MKTLSALATVLVLAAAVLGSLVLLWGQLTQPPGGPGSLRWALREATEVHIYRWPLEDPQAQDWPKRPLAVLREDSQSKLLHLLKNTRTLRGYYQHKGAAEWKFVFLAGGQPLYEVTCNPHVDYFGKGEEWAVMPEELRAWLRTKASGRKDRSKHPPLKGEESSTRPPSAPGQQTGK